MTIFSGAPRLPVAPPAASNPAMHTFTTFPGLPFAHRTPRLVELNLRHCDVPPATKFRLLRSQMCAFDRSPRLPDNQSGADLVFSSFAGASLRNAFRRSKDAAPAPPARVAGDDALVPKSPSTARERSRRLLGRSGDDGSPFDCTFSRAQRPGMVKDTADKVGPGRYNLRREEDDKLRREHGATSAAFKLPAAVTPRTRKNEVHPSAVHSYEAPVNWSATASHHKNVKLKTPR
jgi:hypothetical protein